MSKLFSIVLILLSLTGFVFADSKPATDKDLFQVKSIWTGQESNDPRKAKRIEWSAKLVVTKRDGEKFTAKYIVHQPGNDRALQLEGTIKDGVITAKATKVLHGTWGAAMEVSWEGRIKDNQLVLKRLNEKKLVVTTELSDDKDAKDDEPDPPSGAKK